MKTLMAAAAGLAIGISAPAFAQDRAQAPKGEAARHPAPPQIDLSKQPTLYVVGYAHLDTQWRWTYADTIREFIPNTLKDNFKLFEKYPHYVFNFSGSRRYRMMEEYYPADFERLKGYVASGQWFPCGSSVDENDANVPSAESLVRQVLYGNRYFRQQYGMASDEYMLPDCFGFPAAMPSVLAHCGIKGFSTQKLTWRAVVPIPFNVGVWEGPDGRSVMAALNPLEYVGQVRENLANSNMWQQRIKANGEKSGGTLVDYHYFGTGDQGGAPAERSVAMVEESVGTQGPIKVVSGPADWMFRTITPEQRAKLPTYKGELMLTEHSAGSISSQAYMKRWNRKNELLADAAERASVAAAWMGGRAYPAQKIEDAWYLVLGSQMHDILPGTSVPKAYDYSWNDEVLAGNQFAAVLEDAAAVVISGLDTRGPGTSIVVYNPLSTEREDVVEAEVPSIVPAVLGGARVTGPDGKPVAAQLLGPAGGSPNMRVAFLAKVGPVGFAAYTVELTPAPQAGASTLKVQERQLENEMYIVKLDDNGDVSSIFDKQAKRELLSAPARLGLHYENPAQWPAWNQDWADRQRPARAYVGGPATFKIVENGPARIAVEVTREAEGSTFVQRIRLASGGAAARIEFDTDINWRSRERSLRAAFPLSVSNPSATFDIQTGTVERPNSHESQFEYSFHKWIDLTDAKGDYGATVMCDSKYASDKPDDRTVRLTLLHTPGTRGGYPDQGTQDIGRHHVTYALYAHAGDWRQGKSFAQADRLNQPLVPFRATAHEGSLGKTFSLLRVSDPAVSILAAKKAEEGDEVIIRLREHTGKAAKGVHVAAARPILSAREVDGQERELKGATVQNGELVTDVDGFSLRAFAVKLGGAPAKVAKIESSPVSLPFDTDAISTNANRTDGAIDDKGSSLPAEQFPRSITAEGVTFALGPTGDGQKNAITCRGQEISLPQNGFDRVYILAAASGDVEAQFQVDGQRAPLEIQAWNGYVGQWDHREWPGDTSDPNYRWGDNVIGLEPAFVKPDPVAWYCSHYHTPKGDTFYEYSYLFKYAIDLPASARTLKLPDDQRVKVFAASVAKVGGARAVAARPLFDTFEGHVQDRPRIVPAGGAFTDATEIRIEPGLYWRQGAIRYTADGSEPTAQSPAFERAITLSSPTTLKSAVVGRDGRLGPVATAKLEVNDRTGPSITGVSAMYLSPVVRVNFSEPVDASATDPSHYTIQPPVAITKVELSPDRRSAALTLASAPQPNQSYTLNIGGIKDASPAGNSSGTFTGAFAAPAPVFTLAQVTPEQRGTAIRGVAGLPVKARDPWTLNMFVRTDQQPPNRTIIAGFGKCEQTEAGNARYLAKFVGGIHFWSHNRDVPTRTPLTLKQWQMLTATYDGTTVRVYKDGEKIGERAVEFIDDENVVNIMPKDPWEQRRQFEGDLRDLTIWSTALSDEAVKSVRAAASLP